MRFLMFFLIVFSIELSAQHQAYLDVGNVRALVNSDGLLFHNKITGLGGFEAPIGDSINSIFASAIWMSSGDTLSGKTAKVSIGHEIYGNQDEIYVSPVDIISQKKDTSGKFQRLWKIEKDTVDYHIANWNQPNYQIPTSILEWPGNRNSNTAKILAPFEDIDGDSIYESKQGDYPLILGDQAIYVIANNFKDEPIDSIFEYVPDPNNPSIIIDSIFKGISTPMQIEIHMMLYAYSNSTKEISNSIFVRTKLFHRSNSSLLDHFNFKFSTFNDFDIGGPSDDYMGTDTIRNMVFAYNSRNIDIGSNQIKGYSKNLAAQAVKFLNSSLAGSMEHIDPFTGLWGHQKRFVIPLQNGRWPNGRFLTYGGDGYLYCTDRNNLTSYYFPGNPVLIGDSSQWTALNRCPTDTTYGQHPPSDTRIIGTPKLSTSFLHGTNIELNYAYVFAQDTGGVVASIAALQVAADSVQAFYDREKFVGISEQKVRTQLDFKVYPNPAKETITIETNLLDFELDIVNLQGQLIQQFKNTKVLNISNLTEGIYFVKIKSKSKLGVKRLMVVD